MYLSGGLRTVWFVLQKEQSWKLVIKFVIWLYQIGGFLSVGGVVVFLFSLRIVQGLNSSNVHYTSG